MEVFGNLDKSNFREVGNQNLVSISRGKLKCDEVFEKPSVRSGKHGRRYKVRGGVGGSLFIKVKVMSDSL